MPGVNKDNNDYFGLRDVWRAGNCWESTWKYVVNDIAPGTVATHLPLSSSSHARKEDPVPPCDSVFHHLSFRLRQPFKRHIGKYKLQQVRMRRRTRTRFRRRQQLPATQAGLQVRNGSLQMG